MRKQWLISQQDNYANTTNNVNQFLIDLYLNFSNEKFMYIIHNQEKDNHIHVILCLEKGVSKIKLLEIFPRADIRAQRGSNKKAYEYLTHKNDSNKFQYDLNDIIFNNISNDYFNFWIELVPTNEKKDELEVLDDITDAILDGTFTSYVDILSVYKGVALKYQRTISETLLRVNLWRKNV